MMLMAPVVASSDEPSLPVLLQPQPLVIPRKPLVVRDANKSGSSNAALRPMQAAKPEKPSEPLVVSIDCDGGGCAVSSGLQVQVIAAARPR